MYFKTERGPVRVNPSVKQSSYGSVSQGDDSVPIYKNVWFWLIIVLVILIVGYLWYCMKNKNKNY